MNALNNRFYVKFMQLEIGLLLLWPFLNCFTYTNEKARHLEFSQLTNYELQSVSWSLAEFRHNKIVQSPHENYFNVCRQHKEK